jgi:hypothetical protein
MAGTGLYLGQYDEEAVRKAALASEKEVDRDDNLCATALYSGMYQLCALALCGFGEGRRETTARNSNARPKSIARKEVAFVASLNGRNPHTLGRPGSLSGAAIACRATVHAARALASTP